jgi:hypothetical protein
MSLIHILKRAIRQIPLPADDDSKCLGCGAGGHSGCCHKALRSGEGDMYLEQSIERIIIEYLICFRKEGEERGVGE